MKKFFRYVSQSIAGMIGLSVYILADTYFISSYAGTDGLAVLNLILPLYGLLNALGNMIAVGCATRYSIRQAAGKDVSSFFLQAIFWNFIFALPFTFFGLFFPKQVLAILGADVELQNLGVSYVRIILGSAFLFMANSSMTAFTRNDKNPSMAMVGSLMGSLFNIVFDYIFMFPMNLGMTGAALATALSPVVTSLVCALHFRSPKNTIAFRWQSPRFNHLCACCKLGFSAFVGDLTSAVTISTFNGLILGLSGNIGVAAYGVIANVSSVCTCVFNGLAQGSQPLISNSYGKRDIHKLQSYLHYGIVSALVLAVLIVASIIFQSDFCIALFNRENDPILYQYAKEGIPLYFIGFLAAGLNILMVSYFSATNNPRPAFICSLLRGTIAIVFFAFLLSSLLKMPGVWLSFPASEAFTFLVVLYFYRKERKEMKLHLEAKQESK